MAGKENFSLSVQAIILFISIILFIIYYYHLFAYEKHNRLALAFAIVTFVWFITVFYRYMCQSSDEKDHQHIKHLDLFEVPYSIKCTIGDENCEWGDCNTWILIHFVIYFCVGLYIPNCYIEIILISIICEMLESSLHHTAKFIVDPMVNLTAYYVGSLFSRNNRFVNMPRCQIC
jgi:hypothetical protein